MTNVSLLLVYQPEGGRPLTVARVDNETLLRDAAHHALLEADDRAQQFGEVDRLLGEIERSEAGRLRRVLSLLIPGFDGGSQRAAMPALQ
jgi:hypothetical protein